VQAGSRSSGAARRGRRRPSCQHHRSRCNPELVLIGQAMARPFAAPPGIPADRKAALIAAFERTNKVRSFPPRLSGSIWRSIPFRPAGSKPY